MDEDLKDALLRAGDTVAASLRVALGVQGLPSDIKVVMDGDRVVIGTGSRAVRDAEIGSVMTPPKPTLEVTGRNVAGEAMAGIAAALRRGLA